MEWEDEDGRTTCDDGAPHEPDPPTVEAFDGALTATCVRCGRVIDRSAAAG